MALAQHAQLEQRPGDVEHHVAEERAHRDVLGHRRAEIAGLPRRLEDAPRRDVRERLGALTMDRVEAEAIIANGNVQGIQS